MNKLYKDAEMAGQGKFYFAYGITKGSAEFK
jgi:hypothetical protein